ncbi:MAG TPA: hypothetical protein VFT62_09570 [Mycobacteriales bacterium]|nr:hypothetical protein [Mycobacteriales bacterium]
MTAVTTRSTTHRSDLGGLLLRVLAVAGLGISAYVHLHLASRYPYPGTITGTQLFDIQGAVAAAVGLALLVTGNRWVWRVAFLVGAASLGAVLLYRYVDVGALGPLPNMNDGTWQPTEKVVSTVAEGAVVLFTLLHEAVRRLAGRVAHAPRGAGW